MSPFGWPITTTLHCLNNSIWRRPETSLGEGAHISPRVCGKKLFLHIGMALDSKIISAICNFLKLDGLTWLQVTKKVANVENIISRNRNWAFFIRHLSTCRGGYAILVFLFSNRQAAPRPHQEPHRRSGDKS